MDEQEVEIFMKMQPQIKSAYDEIGLLSKKKPTDQLNNFKLKFINSILSRADEILGDEYKPFPEEFTSFDEDDMPNNSDVVFILSHYMTSLENLRCDNIERDDGNYCWYWLIDGEISDLETHSPE